MSNKLYILDSKLLQPFDIIMEKGETNFSNVYNKRYGTPYTHAKLYIGNGSYIDADGTGVKAQQVERTLYESQDDAIVLRYNGELIDEQKKVIELFVRSEIGKEFHIPLRVNPMGKSDDKNELNREYCVRLVASAYQTAGIEIADDVLYCQPKDFINSTLLIDAGIKLKEANDDDIQYANSICIINKQDEICANMFERIRQITQADIQTEGQIVDFLIKNPSFDDEIYNSLKNDPYFSMLEQYHNDHPEEYNVQSFILRYREKAAIQANYMSKNADEIKNRRYSINLTNYSKLYQRHNLKTCSLFVNLYHSLIMDCEKRKNMCIEVLNILQQQ